MLIKLPNGGSHDVALVRRTARSPIALAACLHVDFVPQRQVSKEQSMGIHQHSGAELLDL